MLMTHDSIQVLIQRAGVVHESWLLRFHANNCTFTNDASRRSLSMLAKYGPASCVNEAKAHAQEEAVHSDYLTGKGLIWMR